VKGPARATERYELAPGVVAIAPGLGWLPASRALLVADAHLAYEDVIGGALPLWSTAEIIATLALVAQRMGAREIVFLGDIVHGAHMSEGAMRTVRGALDALREHAELVLIAGNHEGRSRAFAVLGETVEFAERDGWLLVHGDGPPELGRRTIIGHLHPSIRLGGGKTIPAFAAHDALVVVPAFTPYSSGLDIASVDFAAAVGAWSVRARDMHLVAAALDRVYPFGSLASFKAALRSPVQPPPKPSRFRKRHIRADL